MVLKWLYFWFKNCCIFGLKKLFLGSTTKVTFLSFKKGHIFGKKMIIFMEKMVIFIVKKMVIFFNKDGCIFGKNGYILVDKMVIFSVKTW